MDVTHYSLRFEAENDSEDVPCLLVLLLLSPRTYLVQTIFDLYRLL